MRKYTFFGTDEIKPSGWLRRQLEIQAEGLSGALDKVWRDIRDSAWIGGDAEGWERVPYWLDGFIPLAFLLEDEDMQARAKKYIDAIIDRQRSDGWICPCSDEERSRYDVWAVFLICKVLVLYYDCSHDKRALDAASKALKNLYDELCAGNVSLFRWGRFRWFECFISIERIYDMYKEEWLLELCRILRSQGADYTALTQEWKTPINQWRFETHIVNIVMALKAEAVSHRLLGTQYTDEAESLWGVLEEYNATSVGAFTGDECLSGISPIQGTELCSVVELMYSAECLFAATGDVKWAERLERVAFNALPATLTEDMWAHQYDQMSNQIEAVPFPGKSVFRTNGAASHIFGLEPHFGCCTSNFSQGWPKLCTSVFLKGDGEIINTTPIPSVLRSELDGLPFRIEIKTLYPFRDSVTYKVCADGAEFALKICVPSWVKSVKLNGEEAEAEEGYIKISRVWQGEQSFELEFEREVETKTLGGGLYFVKYGPLTFSLPIKGRSKTHEYTKNGVERKFPYCDYHIYREGEFAYGFASDSFRVLLCEENEKTPFSHDAPMIKIEADMAKINWEMADGYRNVPAKYPSDIRAVSMPEKIELVPYGCTALRMTEMPFVRK